MPKVKNEDLQHARVGVLDAVVEFDGAGVAEVSAEQAEHLAQIPGFEIVPDAPKAEKVVAKVVETPAALPIETPAEKPAKSKTSKAKGKE